MVRATTFDFSATHSPHTNDELRAIVQALQAEAQAREALQPAQTFTMTISREPPAAAPIGTINTAVVPIECQIIGRRGNRKLKQPMPFEETPGAMVIRCIARAQTAPQHGSALREADINPKRRRPATRTISFADWQEWKLREAGLLPHSFKQRKNES